MSDEFKVQWSISLPPVAQYAKGNMLNIRGNTTEEVNAQLDELIGGDFVEKATELSNLLYAAQALGQDTVTVPPPAEPIQPATVTPISNGRVCNHGKMTYKEPFTSKAGKPMGASWNCPLGWKDPNSCKTQWVDD